MILRVLFFVKMQQNQVYIRLQTVKIDQIKICMILRVLFFRENAIEPGLYQAPNSQNKNLHDFAGDFFLTNAVGRFLLFRPVPNLHDITGGFSHEIALVRYLLLVSKQARSTNSQFVRFYGKGLLVKMQLEVEVRFLSQTLKQSKLRKYEFA